MNSKKSWAVFALAIIWFVAVIWGFAHGAQAEGTGAKVAWIGGSLAFAALGVLLSYTLKKKE